MVSDKIYENALPLKALIDKLGFSDFSGKELRIKLMPYKIGNYHEWDDGGYVKRPVYYYLMEYYC